MNGGAACAHVDQRLDHDIGAMNGELLVVAGIAGGVGMPNNCDIGLAPGAGRINNICQRRQVLGRQRPRIEVEVNGEECWRRRDWNACDWWRSSYRGGWRCWTAGIFQLCE